MEIHTINNNKKHLSAKKETSSMQYYFIILCIFLSNSDWLTSLQPPIDEESKPLYIFMS